MFITIEAIDGAGKSTQARLLRQALTAAGHEVTLTREPGGSPGAEEIRHLLVSGAPDRWSEQTEILLFTAARNDHLERTILPALERGAVVISDRYVDSTRVYQGMRGEHLRAVVDGLHGMIIKKDPDLTLILDMDADEAWSRGRDRNAATDLDEDRMEKKGVAFQRGIRKGFLAIAAQDPGRCVVIDAVGSPEEVAARILDVVNLRLGAVPRSTVSCE